MSTEGNRRKSLSNSSGGQYFNPQKEYERRCNIMLAWFQEKTKNYEDVKIENLGNSWVDGLYLAALLNHFYPEKLNYNDLKSKEPKERIPAVFGVLKKTIGEDNIMLDEEDLIKCANKRPKMPIKESLKDLEQGKVKRCIAKYEEEGKNRAPKQPQVEKVKKCKNKEKTELKADSNVQLTSLTQHNTVSISTQTNAEEYSLKNDEEKFDSTADTHVKEEEQTDITENNGISTSTQTNMKEEILEWCKKAFENDTELENINNFSSELWEDGNALFAIMSYYFPDFKEQFGTEKPKILEKIYEYINDTYGIAITGKLHENNDVYFCVHRIYMKYKNSNTQQEITKSDKQKPKKKSVP